MWFSVILSCLLALSIAAPLNDRPIIGILTQPVGSGSPLEKYGDSYIAASYVKYVESGGARVVPIFHNSTTAQLDAIFNSINGILFPGGGADLDDTPLFKSGAYLFNLALAANDKGDFFPVIGHCMGFELIALIVSKNFNILSSVDAENISLPLNFTSAAYDSKWLSGAPKNIMDILATEPVTMNNHVECVDMPSFTGNEYLPKFFNILSMNKDRKGKQFISTWEGMKYPVFGAQWHAEKPQFEWNPDEVINHSTDAIISMQYFSNFLVNQGRKSGHHFASPVEENNALIYNYSPIYSEAVEPSFEQVYVW